MVSMYSKSFEDLFDNKADINELLKSLDTTIKKLVSSSYQKTSYYTDKEDVFQEVRIHICDIYGKGYLNGMTGLEAYMYLVKSISSWARRVMSRQAKKISNNNRIDNDSYFSTVSLSLSNIDFLNIKASLPVGILIDKLKDKCKDIKNFDAVISFLLDGTDKTCKTAGLSSKEFYSIVSKIRERVKEIEYD